MKHSNRIPLRGYACAVVTLLALLASAPGAWSRTARPATCEMMTEPKATALFKEWNDALQVRPYDPTKVALTYTPDAVLLPTVKNGPLNGRANIRGYFVKFLMDNPFGKIDTRDIVPAGCNMGVVAGLYTFAVDEGGRRVNKPARYTFVYVYMHDGVRNRWLIAHHHSSLQPEKGAQ